MKTSMAIGMLAGAVMIPGVAAVQGVSFEHKDWQLFCDNTGTCRAAGYQADDGGPAISVLLVRRAGPHAELTGKVQLGAYTEEDMALAKGVKSLALKDGGRTVAMTALDPATRTGDLTPATLASLMQALLRAPGVTWASGQHEWKLSTAGASAVLLKMDEAQGRIGTTGAIVRKGAQPEDGVPNAVAAPVVIAAPVPKENKQDKLLTPSQRAVLRAELRRITRHETCPGLYEALNGESAIDVALARLSAGKLVAWITCETYAYNESSKFWVVNAAPLFAPAPVGVDANDYGDGVISSSQKGRGLADCISSGTWTWNGTQFVATSATTSGMCRSIAPGGAWNLPTLVTTVRKSGSAAK